MKYEEFKAAFETAYTNTLNIAVDVLGVDAVENYIHECHEEWENGTRYVFENAMMQFMGCIEKRDQANEEAEFAACLNQAGEYLAGKAKAAYVQNLPRQEVVDLLNKAGGLYETVNTKVGDMTCNEMMQMWNRSHEGCEINYASDYSI